MGKLYGLTPRDRKALEDLGELNGDDKEPDNSAELESALRELYELTNEKGSVTKTKIREVIESVITI